MSVALFDTQHVLDIADAIRGVTGDAATMTIGQMPTRIAALLAAGEVECWLEKSHHQSASLPIDTGVAGDMEHTIEVTCRAFPAYMACPFSAVTSSTSRQGFRILSEGNKIQRFWANTSNMSNTPVLDRSVIDLNDTITVTLNKTGMVIVGNGKGNANTPHTYNDPFAAGGTASTATYQLFNYPIATGSNQGLFREAKIYGDPQKTTLLHDFVPVINREWRAFLLDKVTGSRTPLPAGYICHIDNAAQVEGAP